MLGKFGLTLAYSSESLFKDLVLGCTAEILVCTRTAGVILANLAAGLTTVQAAVLIASLADAVVDCAHIVKVLLAQSSHAGLFNELGLIGRQKSSSCCIKHGRASQYVDS